MPRKKGESKSAAKNYVRRGSAASRRFLKKATATKNLLARKLGYKSRNRNSKKAKSDNISITDNNDSDSDYSTHQIELVTGETYYSYYGTYRPEDPKKLKTGRTPMFKKLTERRRGESINSEIAVDGSKVTTDGGASWVDTPSTSAHSYGESFTLDQLQREAENEEAFYKNLHTPYEAEEIKSRKWDAQRMRELSKIASLQEKQKCTKTEVSSECVLKYKNKEIIPPTFLPDVTEIKGIMLTEELPITMFSTPLNISEFWNQPFTTFWKKNRKA